MAKKIQKGKPVKKAAAPVKKEAVKKTAKKTVPKKAAKPAKKAVAKKIVKTAAPKKAVKKDIKTAKKIVKKTAPKKAVKKTVKQVKKSAAKATVKKIAAAKPAKKTTPKKNASKPAVKAVISKITPVKAVNKTVSKTETKQAVSAKPLPIVKIPVSVEKKAETISKKKFDSNFDLDDDNRDEEPMMVEYKTPSIHRPMGPVPKPHINTDKRTRYTDSELKEFKELILKKLEEAQKDYELLKSTLSHKDDHGTDDTSPTFKLLEDGSDVLSKEETSHLAGRQEKFIQNLQNALIRIENKTYGICRATGKLISKERLRSVPHATLAIEAKLEQNA